VQTRLRWRKRSACSTYNLKEEDGSGVSTTRWRYTWALACKLVGFLKAWSRI